jgi:hypothetical protein
MRSGRHFFDRQIAPDLFFILNVGVQRLAEEARAVAL